MGLKPITKERFDALCRVKLPSADFTATEVEWFTDDEERAPCYDLFCPLNY